MNKIFAALAVLTVSSFALAGPAGGARDYEGTLRPGETHDFPVVLNGQEDVVIVARGTSQGDLDCALYDHDMNELDKDIDSTNLCMIDGHVQRAALFYVRVKNNGRGAQAFELHIGGT